MPIITRFGGGGGGLNFKVNAYSELPASGKENEIAVITDTPMTGYVMQVEQPTGADGLVWIKTDTKTKTPIWADKKQTVLLHPMKAMQYVNGEWKVCSAYAFQGEEWIEVGLPRLTLYDRGYENPIAGELVEDSYGGEKREDSIYVRITGTGTGWCYTAEKIDITEYKTLKAFVGSSGASIMIGVGTAQKTQNTKTTTTVNASQMSVACDISSLQGEYYVNLASSSVNLGWHIYEIWLEQ